MGLFFTNYYFLKCMFKMKETFMHLQLSLFDEFKESKQTGNPGNKGHQALNILPLTFLVAGMLCGPMTCPLNFI